jgi:hypothetical protein
MILMASAMFQALSPGEPMPVLKGEFLTGRPAVLPDAASGRVALLALGFTYDSRFAVEAWVGRFRKDFGDKPEVTFYEVPMIGGMARLGKWFIDSGMRKGTPKKDQENVITVYGGTDSWKTAAELPVTECRLSVACGPARRGAVAAQRPVRPKSL